MDHGIRTTRDALDPHLAIARMQEGQQLCGAIAHEFVRLADWLAFWAPGCAGIGQCLERAGFVRTPEIQADACCRRVGLLNQLFLGAVSGSLTVSGPSLRMRSAVPVRHQVCSRCQVEMASCNTHQIV
jgi:hypothetical protein